MANPLKGEVSFPVGEETFTLAYTINALIVLEERLDMSVVEIGKRLNEEGRLGFLRALFWAGLIERQPSMTEVGAGTLLQAYGPQEARAKILDAFIAAFPKAAAEGVAEGEAGPQKAARRGTGRRSSSSGTS